MSNCWTGPSTGEQQHQYRGKEHRRGNSSIRAATPPWQVGSTVTITGPSAAAEHAACGHRRWRRHDVHPHGSSPAPPRTANLNGITPADPIQYSCQQNFVILSTDGYWNGNAGYQVDGNHRSRQSGRIGGTDRSMTAPPESHDLTTNYSRTYQTTSIFGMQRLAKPRSRPSRKPERAPRPSPTALPRRRVAPAGPTEPRPRTACIDYVRCRAPTPAPRRSCPRQPLRAPPAAPATRWPTWRCITTRPTCAPRR